MAGNPRPIRGHLLEVGPATDEEREWIFSALCDPGVYEPFGCRAPPNRTFFDAGVLELMRDGTVEHEPVRFHALRSRDDGRTIGFFVDFGWDFPQDPVREIDLAFPDPRDRSIGRYVDATYIIAQYLFVNGFAKRIRWRVETRPGRIPARSTRQGARLIQQVEETHPSSGEPIIRCVFEYAMADFLELTRAAGMDPFTQDYGDAGMSAWEMYRRSKES